MANRQGGGDLRFAQVSAPQLILWLGLALHTVANKATVALCNFFTLLAADSTHTQSNKLTTYKLLIRSIPSYAAHVCSSTSPSNYLRLQDIQSKCLRVKLCQTHSHFPTARPSKH